MMWLLWEMPCFRILYLIEILKSLLYWFTYLGLMSLCHLPLFMPLTTESPRFAGHSMFCKILLSLTTWMVPLPSCSSGNWGLPWAYCIPVAFSGAGCFSFYSSYRARPEDGGRHSFRPLLLLSVHSFSILSKTLNSMPSCWLLLPTAVINQLRGAPQPHFSMILVPGSPSLSVTLCHYW